MKRIIILNEILALLLVTSYANSFDEVITHPAISEQAVIKSAPEGFSSLDEWLQANLNFLNGINEDLSNGTETRTVKGWVQEGSTREDDGIQYFNHFHNPLRAWDRAGLRILGLQIGNSSVLWGQNPRGTLWQDARQKYFEGLTASTQSDRDGKLAETFELLGKLIHLPQDAAVPAHTRNDPHPPWNPDGLERFMRNLRNDDLVAFNELLQRSPVPFDKSILDLTPNPLAAVPIARIIDGTDPEQTEAVPSAGNDQGVSEYSNANFLSGDTIFKDFTFPRLQSIDLQNPFPLNNRQYFTKIADGETGFFLVAEGTFTERLLSLASGDKGFVLDPRVYQDYAQKLLPRAVGYSAGLIDYFFRGSIFAVGTVFQDPEPQENSARLLGVFVQNTTSESMTGEFGFYAFTGELQERIATWSNITMEPGEWALLCLPEAAPTPEACTFATETVASPPTLPVCPDTPRRFGIVFSGAMGQETEGAVTAGFWEECFAPDA